MTLTNSLTAVKYQHNTIGPRKLLETTEVIQEWESRGWLF